MRTFRILTLMFCCGTSSAWAIKECEADGKSINLSNGNSTAQLTGTVRCRDQGSSEITREIPYRNGVVDGVEKMLASDGNWHETTYRAGKRHGLTRTLSQAGKLLADAQYVNDRELGDSHVYHTNGRVKAHYQISATGKTRTYKYDEAGRVNEMSCTGTNDVGVVGCEYGTHSEGLKIYYPSGKVQYLITLKNGLREGVTEHFVRDDTRRTKMYFTSGKLRRVEHFSVQGKLSEKTEYAEDERQRTRKEGFEERFFADGKLKERIEWRQGRKVAAELRWQNGQVRQRLSSKNPREELEETFFDNGKPESIEPRLQSSNKWGRSEMQRHGTVQRYYQNGQLAAEEKYLQGQLSGIAHHYYENGQLSAHEEHKTGRLVKRKSFSKEGKLEKDETYHEDGSRVR